MQLLKYVFLTDNSNLNFKLFDDLKTDSNLYFRGKKLIINGGTKPEPDVLEIIVDCTKYRNQLIINIYEFDRNEMEANKSIGKYINIKDETILNSIFLFLSDLKGCYNLYRDEDLRLLKILFDIWDWEKIINKIPLVRTPEKKQIQEVSKIIDNKTLNLTNKLVKYDINSFNTIKSRVKKPKKIDMYINWEENEVTIGKDPKEELRRYIFCLAESLVNKTNTEQTLLKFYIKKSNIFEDKKYLNIRKLMSTTENNSTDDLEFSPSTFTTEYIEFLHSKGIEITKEKFEILYLKTYEYFVDSDFKSATSRASDTINKLRIYLNRSIQIKQLV